MQVEGPKEKTPEAKELERQHGFSYRNLLGELIYAYVIARVDIGFAVCFLSRFASNPHHDHFVALKNVCRYLRATKDWGIIYRRPKPLDDLPPGSFKWLDPNSSLPPFPSFHGDELVGVLDAAHATDLKTHRSVTGIAIYYGGAVIAWKSRLQPTVSTSSTEAEFLAAVHCAKMVIYLRSILQELNALRDGPTKLLIDNEAALKVINECRPTPRVRHIDIQHFAIQQWRKWGLVVMEHLPGLINASDDLTKPLSWVLHGRHARRNMGHYNGSILTLQTSSGSVRAGESVGANIPVVSVTEIVRAPESANSG